MTIQELIQKYLPQDLRESAAKYDIAGDFIETMPDLIELVLRSSSIDKPEDKQSRFSLLPLMTDEQVAKLRDILTREKQKLAEIEAKYEEKKIEIQKKYTMQQQNLTAGAAQIAQTREEEAQARHADEEAAEALLNTI